MTSLKKSKLLLLGGLSSFSSFAVVLLSVDLYEIITGIPFTASVNHWLTLVVIIFYIVGVLAGLSTFPIGNRVRKIFSPEEKQSGNRYLRAGKLFGALGTVLNLFFIWFTLMIAAGGEGIQLRSDLIADDMNAIAHSACEYRSRQGSDGKPRLTFVGFTLTKRQSENENGLYSITPFKDSLRIEGVSILEKENSLIVIIDSLGNTLRSEAKGAFK